jgi:hypothetical protein
VKSDTPKIKRKRERRGNEATTKTVKQEIKQHTFFTCYMHEKVHNTHEKSTKKSHSPRTPTLTRKASTVSLLCVDGSLAAQQQLHHLRL